MTRPGIEPRSPGQLANILLIRPMARMNDYTSYKRNKTIPNQTMTYQTKLHESKPNYTKPSKAKIGHTKNMPNETKRNEIDTSTENLIKLENIYSLLG